MNFFLGGYYRSRDGLLSITGYNTQLLSRWGRLIILDEVRWQFYIKVVILVMADYRVFLAELPSTLIAKEFLARMNVLMAL